MKRALVTGSAGLVGRHMAAELTARGWHVTAIDVNTPARPDARAFFRVNDTRYDLAAHCAAHVGGRRDIENRQLYIAAVNYQLDAAMFEWALRTRPSRVIYWSSSAAYPVAYQHCTAVFDDDPLPLRESDIDLADPQVPDLTYGAVKLAGEQMASLATAEGIRTHVFRPFSGWAADQDTSYPMGAYLDRARRRADPFDVWGDGEQVRDFIHIDDFIGAALAAVDQDYPGPLNLCTGVGTNFNQLADLVCKSADYTPQIRHRPEKPVGVHYRVGDPTEMLKVYTPKTSLDDGVTQALANH